ncbi:hypothetical protein SAMN04488564_10215 [Lentzea waywayandensis]|uniref:Excreted virulence factor EspC, type VII ESX diderm n=1 Tax=Lentzea waywayandensis TaxID=84724 RepID=A0A1I6D907_9PSEU|nr:hypothetical protein [Lentzea waywayandensis]SFR01914.1 hypothetical protein SAMN04488564_10215 [Lentzea waywayandensis]
MAESYEVVTASLTSHVRTLTDLSGELGTALTAATVTVTGDAYGQAGRRFAKALGDVASSGQDTLRTAIEALEKAAAALRDTVTAYEQQEEAVRAGLTRIGDER